MTRRLIQGIVAIGLMSVPSAVGAQTMGGLDAKKWFITAGGGFQGRAVEIVAEQALPVYGETSRVTNSRTLGTSPLGDLTVGMRIGERFGVGFGASARKIKSNGSSVATIPHPVFFNQLRTVAGSVDGMQHSEAWASVLGFYRRPITDKIDVTVMAGPSVAFVRHEAVSNVTVVEGTSPSVTLTVETIEKSSWGFVGGLDVFYGLTQFLDAGLFTRYHTAPVNLGSSGKIDVGGPEIGGAIRVSF